MHLVTRDDGEYEQVVLCELLIPDTPNVFGDIYTAASIREFVYEFARQGFGLDINHDKQDQTGDKLLLVESFIARAGDPTFIKDSWVVGMKILDDDVWQQVLDGELNGFSFEALCYMEPIIIENLKNRQVTGTTEPDPVDGHTHTYLVILDPLNRPVSGGTGYTDLHAHKIVSHTITQHADTLDGREHNHRFQVIVE